MREILQEIVSLQKQYSSSNTPAMQQRGHLIRDVLPHELRTFAAPLRAAMGSEGEDAEAEGSDGTGQKAWVPWARWHSTSRSPSAQVGWYVVYLFHPDASGVSLCLSHGSTQMIGNSYVQRSDAQVQGLMSWAWGVVGHSFDDDPSVRRGIKLGRRGLSEAYERTTVFSKFYPNEAIPTDQDLTADLLRFMRPLAELYRAQVRGQEPGSPGPDVIAARSEIETIANPRRRRNGQGRGLSAELRKVVEQEAMRRACEWLKDQNFTFRDVSARECCDFRADRDGEGWVIEVKGTTGDLKSVLLTPNEVNLHRLSFPRNALIVVFGLSLSDDGNRASGGRLVAYCPWQLQDDRLSPVGYEYRLD